MSSYINHKITEI